MKRYILDKDARTPVLIEDRSVWLAWWKDNSKAYIRKTVCCESVVVSTLFSGLADENDTTPQLFETIVLGGFFDCTTTFYTNYDEAVKGHRDMLRLVDEALAAARSK